MSKGNNKCAACGQWAGRGHTCPALGAVKPPAEPVAVVTGARSEAAAAKWREQVSERVAAAEAALAENGGRAVFGTSASFHERAKREAEEAATGEWEAYNFQGTYGLQRSLDGSLGRVSADVAIVPDGVYAQISQSDYYGEDEGYEVNHIESGRFETVEEARNWVDRWETLNVASQGVFGASPEEIAHDAASALHDQWREARRLPDGTYEPRMKDDGNGGQVDIANTPYGRLPKKWQAENKAAAEGTVEAILLNPNASEDEIASIVHDQWLERNGDWAEPHQKLPYEQLSEEEKEKDRVVVRTVKSAAYKAREERYGRVGDPPF